MVLNFIPGIISEFVVKPIHCAAHGERYNADLAAVVNPARAIHSIVQVHQSANDDKSRGVWVGRRGLGPLPFTINGVAGVADAAHWAILINGKIYEINGQDKASIGFHGHHVWHDEMAKTYEWNKLNTHLDITVSHEDLVRYGESTAQEMRPGRRHAYNIATGKHCQWFVTQMLAYACGLGEDKAREIIVAHVGTFFW